MDELFDGIGKAIGDIVSAPFTIVGGIVDGIEEAMDKLEM